MRTMTLEELLMKEDDGVILDIYNELESCVVPATGYAHAYCRKVNKMINAGNLCTVRDKYRNVYLPTLSKLIFKEMARRYSQVLYNQKTMLSIVSDAPTAVKTNGDDIEEAEEATFSEPRTCIWCGQVFDRSDVRMTDLGLMCDTCITAVRSRGEEVTVYD